MGRARRTSEERGIPIGYWWESHKERDTRKTKTWVCE
jgi:hypothetical protein